MKILLTGAAGFIGSHVARELVRGGHEVHATVLPTDDLWRIRDIEPSLKLYRGTLDLVPVEPDLAISLAWYAVPGKYLTAPENRECLEQSLRLLKNLRCRAVFAGTCFEYDTSLGLLREDSPTTTSTLYTQCKDALRREVVKRPGTAWVRFFYLYGPYEDPRRLVPSVIRSVQRGEPANVSPGEQGRDFLHVEDVASAVCATAFSRLEGAVNIGSGEAPTVREIVTKIGALGGRPDLIRLGAVPYYPGEPMLIQADNSKLQSTGWLASYDLDRGLAQTFEWWSLREGGS
jgi:nucleoside-diphosphate-sugar epimerase